MPETSTAPPAVSRPSKPVSEALLNEKVGSPQSPATIVCKVECSIGLGNTKLMSRCAVVGSLSLLPSHPVVTRSILRCRLLGAAV